MNFFGIFLFNKHNDYQNLLPQEKFCHQLVWDSHVFLCYICAHVYTDVHVYAGAYIYSGACVQSVYVCEGA